MLICFDFDGVIADTFASLLLVCREAQYAVGCGREPLDKDFREAENLTFVALGQKLGIPQAQVGDVAQQVFSRLDAKAEPVFESLPDALSVLANDHQLCVVTANTGAKVAATLDAAGISDLFSAIYTGEDGLAKSAQILAACRRFQFAPTETVMVGDTLGDIRMGKAAGVSTIAVTWGYQQRTFLESVSPDAFAGRPEDLVAVIKGIKDNDA